ncbi:MAG: alpha/beta hydrolase [Chloroflexota bacterium]
MNTSFVTSPDGTRIAYECSGAGPALVLVHGGGGSRLDWQEAGYVERLRDRFTVITLDLRGHGESALSSDPADYTLAKQHQDILAVADACGAQRFSLWSISYGSKISRYLGIQSERIDRLALMSAVLGPGATEKIRQEVLAFCEHWPPILQAQAEGRLDLDSLSERDRELLANVNVAAMLGWGPAMAGWPAVDPAGFRCPTLWLVGAEDPNVMDSYAEYREALAGTKVQARLLEGLDHGQVFYEIDTVLPILLEFMQAK